jgi:hypothetical protein
MAVGTLNYKFNKWISFSFEHRFTPRMPTR